MKDSSLKNVMSEKSNFLKDTSVSYRFQICCHKHLSSSIITLILPMTRTFPIVLLTFYTLINLSQSDCPTQCSTVQSPDSGHQCQVCYTNCDSQYSIYNCYETYEDCSIIVKGGCLPIKNYFQDQATCQQKCCSSLGVGECVQKFGVATQTSSSDLTWLWVVLGVLPPLIVAFVVVCYCWHKKNMQKQANDIDASNGQTQNDQRHLEHGLSTVDTENNFNGQPAGQPVQPHV